MVCVWAESVVVAGCEAAGVVGGRSSGQSCDCSISPELSALCLCGRSSEQRPEGGSGARTQHARLTNKALLQNEVIPILCGYSLMVFTNKHCSGNAGRLFNHNDNISP